MSIFFKNLNNYILIFLIIIYYLIKINNENFTGELDKSIKKNEADSIIKDKIFYKEKFCIERENICKVIIKLKNDVDKHINDFINLKKNSHGTNKDYCNEKKNKFFVIKEKMDDLILATNNEFKCINKEKKFNKNCNNSSEDSPDESPD